jgi:hypothetical protein
LGAGDRVDADDVPGVAVRDQEAAVLGQGEVGGVDKVAPEAMTDCAPVAVSSRTMRAARSAINKVSALAEPKTSRPASVKTPW